MLHYPPGQTWLQILSIFFSKQNAGFLFPKEKYWLLVVFFIFLASWKLFAKLFQKNGNKDFCE